MNTVNTWWSPRPRFSFINLAGWFPDTRHEATKPSTNKQTSVKTCGILIYVGKDRLITLRNYFISKTQKVQTVEDFLLFSVYSRTLPRACVRCRSNGLRAHAEQDPVTARNWHRWAEVSFKITIKAFLRCRFKLGEIKSVKQHRQTSCFQMYSFA